MLLPAGWWLPLERIGLVLLWHFVLCGLAPELAALCMRVLQAPVPTASVWLPHGLSHCQLHSSRS